MSSSAQFLSFKFINGKKTLIAKPKGLEILAIGLKKVITKLK